MDAATGAGVMFAPGILLDGQPFGFGRLSERALRGAPSPLPNPLPPGVTMQQYLPYLLVLACPVGMGLMMWFMMRGQHSPQSPPSQQEEIAMLRAEIATLREQQQRPHDSRDSTGSQP